MPRAGVVWALLILAGAASVTAQNEPQEKPQNRRRELTDLSLEELMALQVDEVYGASRFAQKIADAPASVTVITAEDIKKFGYRTLADALRSVRGAYVTYDRTYSYLGLRGFNQVSDYSDRLLFLVDGHRGNDALFDAGAGTGDSLLDIDEIERIEVIRGPASSLYGSNAYLGVISLMSRRPQDPLGLETSASIGSFGTTKASLSYSTVTDGGVAVRVSGSAYVSDGQTLFYPEFNSPSTGNGYTAGADGQHRYNLLVHASYQGLTLEGAFVSRLKTVPTASWGTVFPSRHSDVLDQRAFLDLKYEHEFDGKLTVLARLFGDGYWFTGNYEYDDGSGNLYLNKGIYRSEGWGAEVVVSRPFLDNALKVTVGGEFRDNVELVQKNYDDVTPRVTYLDSRESTTVLAAFAQAEWRILPELLLNAGLRLDHYDTFGNSVAPRAALIYQPMKGTSIKAIYGHAFRAPSASEFFYEDGFIQKRNPNLGPEKVDTYELTFEHELTDGVQVVASGFYYHMHDLISLATDPSDGLIYYDNLNEVKTFGLEVELQAKLGGGVEGGLSYSRQVAKTVNPDTWLTNSPKNLAKLRISVPLVPEKLFASAEAQFVSARKSLANTLVDGYGVVNFTLFGRELLKNFEFSASVTNLLNSRFYEPGGPQHSMDRIEQDGRGFSLKLTYRF